MKKELYQSLFEAAHALQMNKAMSLAKAHPTRKVIMKSRNVLAMSISALIGILATSSAFAGGSASGDKATYEAKCAVCHGKDGSGNTPQGKKLNLRDLRSADVQKQSDAELFNITANGKEKMPAYGKKLTEDQIHALVAYIRELAP